MPGRLRRRLSRHRDASRGHADRQRAARSSSCAARRPATTATSSTASASRCSIHVGLGPERHPSRAHRARRLLSRRLPCALRPLRRRRALRRDARALRRGPRRGQHPPLRRRRARRGTVRERARSRARLGTLQLHRGDRLPLRARRDARLLGLPGASHVGARSGRHGQRLCVRELRLLRREEARSRAHEDDPVRRSSTVSISGGTIACRSAERCASPRPSARLDVDRGSRVRCAIAGRLCACSSSSPCPRRARPRPAPTRSSTTTTSRPRSRRSRPSRPCIRRATTSRSARTSTRRSARRRAGTSRPGCASTTSARCGRSRRRRASSAGGGRTPRSRRSTRAFHRDSS